MNTINKHGKSHSWKCISALCTKKSISSLSQTSSKPVNPIVCSLRTQGSHCNYHICLVFPIFQHHKEFFLDPGWFTQHLWASDLLNPTGGALQSCLGQCTGQGPSWLSPKFRNGHSGREHIDKRFQQCINAEPGLSPEWSHCSSRGRQCAPGPDRNVEFCSVSLGFLKTDILQEDTVLLYCKHNLTVTGQSILTYCFKWN